MKTRIKELRKQQKLSQQELGERVGVTKQMIHQWETGQRIPQTPNLLKLKKVLNVTLDDLVSD